MHLEIAQLTAKDGDAPGLLKAMHEGGGIAALLTCPGCHSVKALRGVENPEKVVFLIEWDSVDAHDAAKSGEGFQAFVRIAGPFFGSGAASVEHFDLG